jgi:hypothetical protein
MPMMQEIKEEIKILEDLARGADNKLAPATEE